MPIRPNVPAPTVDIPPVDVVPAPIVNITPPNIVSVQGDSVVGGTLLIGPGGCGKNRTIIPNCLNSVNGTVVLQVAQHKPDYGKTAFDISDRTKDKDKEMDRRAGQMYYESKCDPSRCSESKQVANLPCVPFRRELPAMMRQPARSATMAARA